MRFSARVGIAMAVPAALVLTGCAQASPSVVAYVGPSEVTQRQLDTAQAGLVAGGLVSVARAEIVSVLIQGELAAQIAADHNISITDAQRDASIQQTNLGGLLQIPDARQLAYDIADIRIVSTALGTDAFVSELDKRSVTLNPRFGTLDPKTKGVVEGSTGSLSVVAGAGG